MRIFRALFSVAARAPKEYSSYERFMYKANGYCKYGLLKDDLLSEHSDEVVEALRRLPEETYLQRVFRTNRAANLSMTHQILPESQWTKIEEDLPYLSPILEEVEKEIAEKKNWEDNNPL
ncbi:cytochrome b-c1 complex subunit 7-like [Thrips palmi]|uniref:Cytochrome b-c1 complex subunit 7 n=1 Tax=Thrips palmi TaxID=161013 RepID=A0A6P9A5L3_THRPL|nr:cytochrome b-c1 complex subunit 7-like [Thrips palmi]